MKFRSTLFIAIIALFLAACNMSLAEDITPPPGAGQPAQPQPTTLGSLFPAQAPDVQNGAAIYADNCAACHGESGLSDGVMTQQLTAQDITVPMLGSAEVAHKAAPADWYQMVTLGNIEKFMPPFNSLNEQQRWDVVAYAQSLSNTPAQISQGEELFNENCAECPTDFFTDLEGMAALSTNELVSLLADGGEGIPAMGNSLSEDELTAVALYLRTLTVPASAAAPEAAPEAPSAEATPADGEQVDVTPEADAEVAVLGSVSGKLLNASGGDVPSGMEVTLVGYEHATDAGGTPVEVVNETIESDKSGAYLFEDVDISEGRIFLVETNYQGISFQSELAFTEGDITELTIPDLALYESTTDSGGLVIEQLHISFDMAVENGVQVFELYTISNLSDKAYVFTTDGTSLPFMPLPEGAVNVGLELSQDSAPLMPTDDGFAIIPSEDFYSIIAFFSMPYDNKLELSQPLALPVSSALIIVPEGIKVKADGLTDEGVQPTQQGFNIQMYSGSGLSAGSPLEMTLSGKIKSSGSDAAVDNRQTLLIGAGAFGVVLILAGVWMFLRDRKKVDEDEFEDDEEEDEFESAEEVMDAIIALDDLHRAKKIPDEAYQLRRAELKELLKELA